MVFDLDSPHKKPYEPLIIGQFETVLNNGTPCSQFVTKSSHKECETLDKDSDEDNKDENFMETIIPKTKIICSVPCSLHSRKPPLNGTYKHSILGLAFISLLLIYDKIRQRNPAMITCLSHA